MSDCIEDKGKQACHYPRIVTNMDRTDAGMNSVVLNWNQRYSWSLIDDQIYICVYI